MSSSIHCMCFAEFFMCTRSFKNILIGFAPISYGLLWFVITYLFIYCQCKATKSIVINTTVLAIDGGADELVMWVMVMIAFVAIMEALLIFPRTYSQIMVFQNLIDMHANFQHNFVNGVI